MYMGEVIDEHDLARHIRYRHRIDTAVWSSDDSRWTITGVDTATDHPFELTCRFLWMCQGYYRHEKGYTPDWPGMEDFDGEIVHPQTWPSDIDLSGKQVLVIGSDTPRKVSKLLAREDFVHSTAQIGNSLRVLVDRDLADPAPRAAAVIRAAGLNLDSCERVAPNLEDVFVTATQERMAQREPVE